MVRTRSLTFPPPSIHWIYKWVDCEVLKIPSKVTPEFLKSLREEHLLIPEGEYEEECVLEAPNADKRVCYLNLDGGLKWMTMYEVLISKFGIRILFTHFQFTILEWTGTAPSQLQPNS